MADIATENVAAVVAPELFSRPFVFAVRLTVAMSSLRIVPVAVAPVIVAPPVAPDKVTVNPSSDSTVRSPLTFTVIVLVVSLARKFTVPLGRTPPVKSVAFAGLPPVPVTAQFTSVAPEVRPVRVTVKVNAVEPAFPSALSADRAAIDSPMSPSVMVTTVVA